MAETKRPVLGTILGGLEALLGALAPKPELKPIPIRKDETPPRQ